MAKIIISLLIPLLVSCSLLNRNAHSSVSTMCIDLLSARVAVDVPTPDNFRKGISEGGVCYASTYNDGTIIFNEGSFARFDVEDYKPSGSEHRKKYSIYWGNEKGKFWKKYISGNVRVYYYNVNKESKKKYDDIIKSIRIRKLWRQKSPESSNGLIK